MGNRRVLSVHQEHELLLKLESAGLGESEAQAVVESPKNQLAKRLVELIRFGKADPSACNKTASAVFPVTVDYTQPLAEMIKAGKYDWFNSGITEKHFPVAKVPTGLPTKAEINMELVHFNRTIRSKDAIAELKKQGLRPATLPELLAFGSTYPDKQREFLIVALGSVWQDWGGYLDVAFLGRGGGGRGLGLGWFGCDWDEDYRFAVVRES